jgi:hypothetical protein
MDWDRRSKILCSQRVEGYMIILCRGAVFSSNGDDRDTVVSGCRACNDRSGHKAGSGQQAEFRFLFGIVSFESKIFAQ